MSNQSQYGRWYRVSGGAHLQLSAVDPPDARKPGPVIGPNSRVRPCSGVLPAGEFGVICLDVDADGQIQRGYTVQRMVSLTPESAPPAYGSCRCWSWQSLI